MQILVSEMEHTGRTMGKTLPTENLRFLDLYNLVKKKKHWYFFHDKEKETLAHYKERYQVQEETNT